MFCVGTSSSLASVGAMLDVILTSRLCADTGAKSHVSLSVASLAIRLEHF